MADERDRWLDKAAADRLLRGEPAAPGAEHYVHARAERLRAALDALAEPPPLSGADVGGLPGELRGEAAAVAAFRARGSVLRAEPQTSVPDAALFGSADTVVELGAPAGPAGPGTRRGRPVRFVLAAAVASVAVGGLAAAAGTGLLDRDSRDAAGGLPAASVTVGPSSTASVHGRFSAPLAPPLTTAPHDGESQSGSPSTGNTPGTEGRTTTGPGDAAGTSTGTGTESPASGPTGDKDGRDKSRQGGVDGMTTDPPDGSDRDKGSRTGAVELCKDYRSGKLDEARREKLVRLAKGLMRVPGYCRGVLDVATGGGSSGEVPGSPTGPGSPSRSLGLVPAGTTSQKAPESGQSR